MREADRPDGDALGSPELDYRMPSERSSDSCVLRLGGEPQIGRVLLTTGASGRLRIAVGGGEDGRPA
jgi:hypothetical protein